MTFSLVFLEQSTTRKKNSPLPIAKREKHFQFIWKYENLYQASLNAMEKMAVNHVYLMNQA